MLLWIVPHWKNETEIVVAAIGTRIRIRIRTVIDGGSETETGEKKRKVGGETIDQERKEVDHVVGKSHHLPIPLRVRARLLLFRLSRPRERCAAWVALVALVTRLLRILARW